MGLRRYAVPLVAVAIAATSGCATGSRSTATAESAVATPPTTAAAPTSAASTSAAPTTSAGSATLDYIAPAGHDVPEVHKTVTGAAYQRLLADLTALKPVPQGNLTCNVVNGESGTVTVTAAGHTKVWVVAGSPCRGVRLSTDGTAQPLLSGSITLLEQVRAIAGSSGLARPIGAG